MRPDAAAGVPYQFGNLMSGKVYGVEVWGNYQVTQWWRLSAGFNLLNEDLTFLPGSLAAVGLAFVADDPNHQATLHSSMNLGQDVTWDAYLRELPACRTPWCRDTPSSTRGSAGTSPRPCNYPGLASIYCTPGIWSFWRAGLVRRCRPACWRRRECGSEFGLGGRPAAWGDGFR